MLMHELRIKEHLERQIRQVDTLIQAGEWVEAYKVSLLVVEAIGFYRKYWRLDFSELFPGLLSVQNSYQLVLMFTAELMSQQGRHDAASELAVQIIAYGELGKGLFANCLKIIRAAGRFEEARAICNKLLSDDPQDKNIHSELAQCDAMPIWGAYDYYALLHAVHLSRRPASYLEIGVAMGRSIALAGKTTRAVGIDPDTGESGRLMFLSPENVPALFRTTSDDFFAKQDLKALIQSDTLDLAFLDGLHHFEQTLRDFINVEKFAGPDTLLFIHDGVPVSSLVAERSRTTAFWVGDVWKIIPCLKAVRPDLEIITFPAQPSGLTLVRKLDSGSRILERQFDAIVEHFCQLELPEDWGTRRELLNITTLAPEQVLGLAEIR